MDNPDELKQQIEELFTFRMLYNAAFFNELAKEGRYNVQKTRVHQNGDACVKGWFLVQAILPTGEISNHYKLEYWDLFKIPEAAHSFYYDGYTPQDVIHRFLQFLQGDYK